MAKKLNILIPLTILILVIKINLVCGFGFHNRFKYIERSDKPLNLSQVTAKWIEQPLDHFNENETRTWKMRYAQNFEFYKPNGPIHLFIGGEGPLESIVGFLTHGFVYELARETNGALIMSEHRYYGQSMPLDISNTSNMKYLTSVQALADLAFLLKNVKSTLSAQNSSDTKVVVTGGSYPGNLAAWMKLLYGDLVDTAISVSAPVLAKKNFLEYYEVIGKDFTKYGSPDCYNKIAQMFRTYHEMLSTPEGIEKMKKIENICEYSDLTKKENKQMLIALLIQGFVGTAQNGTTDTFKNKCENLNFKTNFDAYNIITQNEHCRLIDFYKSIDSVSSNLKSWFYQTCNEFGYFQTTDSENQPFTHDLTLDFYINTCKGLFGSAFDESRVDDGVKATNARYGGQHPNVKNVVFVNGDIDPWHPLSVLEDLSADAPAIFIPKTSHCQLLRADEPEDPSELKEARTKVKQLVKGWIGM